MSLCLNRLGSYLAAIVLAKSTIHTSEFALLDQFDAFSEPRRVAREKVIVHRAALAFLASGLASSFHERLIFVVAFFASSVSEWNPGKYIYSGSRTDLV